ncbi:MAG: phospho-sugar mutase [Acidimicrobiales bacterium]
MSDELQNAARNWLRVDPDPTTRAELEALITGPTNELESRFTGRLAFGTAGLRGELGAGPLRMNRVLVRSAAAGVVDALKAAGSLEGPIVIGCDARTNSDVFAHDSARVIAARGAEVVLLPPQLPTPVLAYAVRYLNASAGIMVTASHNPPRDNGYKVYWGDGAQIVEPIDALIASHIDEAGLLTETDLVALDDASISQAGDEVLSSYLSRVVEESVQGSEPVRPDLKVVYSAMHGVGGQTLARLWALAGLRPFVPVEAQFEPDPLFPTVPFPNPEEPGAMDLALTLARETEAALVIANDPDADRLAIAIPPIDNEGWRVLTGNEIGWLLSDYLLTHSQGAERLVTTTIVSSTMLTRIAAQHSVHSARTLTGFKWIVRPALQDPDKNFIFGYEEAIGYACGDLVRDKDGVSGALIFAQMVGDLTSRGLTVHDALDELAQAHGVHITDLVALRFDGDNAQTKLNDLMHRLRSDPPKGLANGTLTSWTDHAEGGELPATNAITFTTETMRGVVRPSGTEPKLKIYLESVQPSSNGLEQARFAAEDQMRLAISEMLALFET